MPNNHTQVIFRQNGGVWQSVNEEKPRIFADFLDTYNLIFDDKIHFVRYKCERETIELRCYGATIRADIWQL